MAGLFPESSTPTFSQSSKGGAQKPGWYSRLIYSYNFHDNKQPWPLDDDAFGQIETNVPENRRGTYIFPVGYLNTINAAGRRYRIKGSFLYGTKTNIDQYLNFKVGLTSEASTNFVRNNDGNNHKFASFTAVTDVPVTFEADIIIVGATIGTPDTWYYKVSGFYQYEWDSYASGGSNNKDVFVPIHQSDVFSGPLTTQTIKIYMTIGTPTTCAVIPVYFTIEEIG